ncbi:unnamed protein product [Rhizoctonia solani]|uniref:PNPLA domain-containing protein n=1 Tax=Rhizoctonia solani TaxID=456999 RepID=A0A8H2WCQ0_9AGAM|nr:unnamed protein product [Rhizoctonia solani]
MSTPILLNINNHGSSTPVTEGNATPTQGRNSAQESLRIAQENLRPVRLLSPDGGGIRGLSALYILREFMNRLESCLNVEGELRPCNYFDMICGTSTGGLIAVMLGKLRITVNEAIDAYARLSESIFGKTKWIWKEGRYSARALEEEISLIVRERALALEWSASADGNSPHTTEELKELGRKVMMRDNGSQTENSKVWV